MTDTTIENILFRAPRPMASPELLKRIQAEIALPTKKPVAKSTEWQSPLRRWFPALAFGVVMLSCAILFAVQSSWSTNLKRQNEALRAATADLPQLRERHAAFDAAQAQREELVQLRKDNEELHQLQAEVAQLRKLPGEIERLQDENRRLSAVPTRGTGVVNGETFFEDAKAEAERIRCVNNLKQLGLGVRIWGGDNKDKYPTSLVEMSNVLGTVNVLICPSDKARQAYASLTFGQFQDNMSSYDYLAQRDDYTYPDCIIAKCPIHHNYLMADGSVQQVDPEKWREVKRDGRLYLESVVAGTTWRDAIVQPIK
jgi:hypothetical protein